MGIPVQVFRSSDVDAPQLTGKRGDTKTIVKACLATGFGTGANRKEPLGWEIVPGTESADGFDCAFKQMDAESGQHIIRIVGGSVSWVLLTAYFDTDTNNNLIDPSAAMTGLPVWREGIHDWILIGHKKSFIFISRYRGIISNDVAGAHSRGFFFGEIENRINNPRGNTLLLRIASDVQSFDYNSATEAKFWAGEYTRLASSLDGAKKWIQPRLSRVC